MKYKKELNRDELEYFEQSVLQQKRAKELYNFDYTTLVDMKSQNSKESSYGHILYKFMKSS